MEVNHYDHIAFLYNSLSKVLGKPYKESKKSFVEELKEGDKVLYLGGGTGGNLPEILKRIGKSGEVFYIESSFQMIRRAKKKVPPLLNSRIKFLQQSNFFEIPHIPFDIIFTQYFLDILEDKEIQQLFQSINERSHKKTKWIFVDFFEVKGKRWLLKFMIYFFRIFTRYPRKKLPDYQSYFMDYGWHCIRKESLNQRFIQAWLMEKAKPEEKLPA